MRAELLPRWKPGFDGPWCLFEIKASRIGRDNMRERLRLCERKGLEFDQCGIPADVRLDGVPYCRKHAGETLLRAVLDESSGS